MEYRHITEPFPGIAVGSDSSAGPMGDLPSTCRYGVFDHGAHTFAWQPAGQRPVLWLSAHSEYSPGLPIRGGVPVVFPWFGAGRHGDQSPAHGYARVADWTRESVVDALADNGTLSVTHTLGGPTAEEPYAGLRAELKVTFSPQQLGLEFTVSNEGEHPVSYEQALHTYLAVSDITQVQVLGLEGSHYLDRAPGGASEPVLQQGPISFTGETDRIYLSPDTVEVVDPGWSRALVVTKQGSADTVVWNPWVAKAAAMPDFGDDEWPRMLCIEAGNLGDHSVTLAPGQTHLMTQAITVRSL